MSRRAAASEAQTGETIILVTMTWGGATYRLSSADVDISTADSQVLPYDGGLEEIEIEESLTAMQGEAEYPSMSVRALLPIDVALLVSRGHDLASAVAEVALHVIGDLWEEREVLLVGNVVEPVYDSDGQPVAFSIEAPPWDDSGLAIATSETVTELTWPTATSTDAPYYPWVFGRPGYFAKPSGDWNTIAGSPALPVEYTGSNADTLLISLGAVQSASVKIYDGTTTETFATVATQFDDLNQECAVVDISAAATISRTETSYYTLWSSGGATLTDDRSGVREGAGDVLEWLLRRSTANVDRARFAAMRERLNEYRIAGYINAETRPWEWVVDHLLPILPISIAGGPAGSYPTIWPLYARTADAVAHLRHDDLCTRIPGVTYQRNPRDLYDQIRLQYAPGIGPDEGIWAGRIVLSVDPNEDTSSTSLYRGPADSFASRIASGRTASRDVVKAPTNPRVMLLDSEIIWDRPTAWRVAREQLRAASSSIRTLRYDCDRAWRWIRPGQVILLSDEEIYLDSQVAVVTGRALAEDGGVTLTVELWESLPRDARSPST